jgi:lactate dehydrogenase-like 2-hydroxyacid dehydrogenase
MDIEGKTLGIIGFGRIGSLVCRKAKAAFNMESSGPRPATTAHRY